MNAKVVYGLTVASLAVFSGDDLGAQCTSRKIVEIYEPEGGQAIEFGSDVGVGDHFIAIGARTDDRGAAYVYGPGDFPWGEPQRLTPESSDYYFGHAVSVDGGKIAVGAGFLDNSGPIVFASDAAYVFRHDGTEWIREQRLTPKGGGVEYGWSVDLSDDRLVVGAPAGGGNRGWASVHSFDGDRWNLDGYLLASDGAREDVFGSKVAVFGDTIAIGAPGRDGPESDSGAVYVFRKEGQDWIEVQMLQASDAEDRKNFGQAIAMAEGLIVVGANGPHPRAVYVFEPHGEGWLETEKVFPSDGDDVRFRFGADIELVGNRMIVAANTSTGAGYVFVRESGRFHERMKLVPFGRVGALGKEWALTGFRGPGKAYLLDADLELRLEVSEAKPEPGDTIGIESYCGLPGGPIVLAVTAIDGTPSFTLVVAAQFGEDFRWSQDFRVTEELSGHRVELQGFGQASDERIVATKPVSIGVR